MTASAIWTVHCDAQGDQRRPDCRWWASQEETEAEANAAARRMGWIVGKRGEPNLCPACKP